MTAKRADVIVVGGGENGVATAYELAKRGVEVIVDEMSLMYLVGTEIDYVEGLMGAGFKFHNPNVKATCGCGSSFSV